MKSLITVMLFIISGSAFAAMDGELCSMQAEKEFVHNQVKEAVLETTLNKSIGFTGEVNVWFLVDDAGMIHIEKIESTDFLAEYHIRKTIEGMQLDMCGKAAGKTFALTLKFAA